MIDGIENLADQAVEGTGSVSHRLCLFCDGFQSAWISDRYRGLSRR